MNKKLDARSSAWIQILALMILLTTLGVVSTVFLHSRMDLTRGREFTLGPAATRALEGLPDKVTVRVVMSKDLPPEFARIRTRLVDLLREFEARSDGRLELSFLDPGEDSASRITALSLGMEEIVFHEQRRDGEKAKKGFFGLALLYRDKKEYFPVLQSVETFEYDLVVRLKRLTGGVKTIGLVGGGDFSVVKARLDPLYQLDPQSPADSAIGSRVDLLWVAAPDSLTVVEKLRIDQFVMSGKPVIFLTPGIGVDLSGGIEAKPLENGYEDLLAHYGIGLRKNLLVEPEQWERALFHNVEGDAEFPVPYPYWLAVSYRTMNAENPITASLQTLSFPWTSALETNPSAQPAARFETLVSTSDQAWEQSWEEVHQSLLYPRPVQAFAPGAQRAFPLAVMATGPMTRILVVSNALFVSDTYADYHNMEGNLQFMLNAIDGLALDPDLIRIRSRQLTDLPLDENRADRFKPLILGVNMLLGPLLLLVLWLFAGLRREKAERVAP